MTIESPMSTSRQLQYRQVLEIRELTDSTYVLRFDRGSMEFTPGQYVSVGPKGDINMREYSIYSSVDAPYLEILVKEVQSGYVSRKLKQTKPGDQVYVEGPFGFFTLPPDHQDHPLFFIATGTGISPFHCFAQSYPSLNFKLIHGVRTKEELYEHSDFQQDKLVACLTKDSGGDLTGRVTDYMRFLASQGQIPKDGLFFLCGNCDMIYEVYDILHTAEIPATQIFAEVYF